MDTVRLLLFSGSFFPNDRPTDVRFYPLLSPLAVRIVHQYIISQARRPPPAHFNLNPDGTPCPVSSLPTPTPTTTPTLTPATSVPAAPFDAPVDGAKLPSSATDDDGIIRGTGGSDLAVFLKRCKTRTVETLVGPSLAK